MIRKALVSGVAVAVLVTGIAIGRTVVSSPTDASADAPAVVPSASGPGAAARPMATPGTFLETFDGSPSEPVPWNPANWDVTVHSRDIETWDALEPMEAHHGEACTSPVSEVPLATHRVTSYADAVFQCRDHMMTAINASGYGLIYVTPAVLADFSAGPATISVDVSTWRSSQRDWWDIWLSPYDDQLQLPFESTDPDLNGPPKNAINIRMVQENLFLATLYRDGVAIPLNGNSWDHRQYDSWLTPDASRRDTFEARISRTGLTFGMPGYGGATWVDATFADLGWSQAVVQFGHHSYNPTKDCGRTNDPGPDGACRPNTWHWDNVEISPSVPFTMIKADRAAVYGSGSQSVAFDRPAPADAHLRFAGIGDRIDVSFDGGATWQQAQTQVHTEPFTDEHFRSYWTPIPVGTSKVLFRGQRGSSGAWRARDITIWSDNGVATPAGLAPTAGADGGPRLLDTRPGATTTDGRSSSAGLQAPGSTVTLQVTGRAGVPADADAVALNLTAVDATGWGYVTAWPCDDDRPNASNLNYLGADPVAAATIVKLSDDGTVCIYNAVSSTQVIADLAGWFSAGSGYTPRTGARLLDTRRGAATIDGAAAAVGPPPVGAPYELQVGGRAGVPAGAAAVALTLTATDPAGWGYLTVWPCSEPKPLASSLNFDAGVTVANAAIVQLGTDGKVCVAAEPQTTEVIVDVTGWFSQGAGYTPQAGARLLDTRDGAHTIDGLALGGGPVGPGDLREVVVAGRGGVPADATSVVLNVTAVDAAGWGYVTAWPCAATRPNSSVLNYVAGKVSTNMALAKLSSSGSVCLFAGESGTGLVVDVVGWFSSTGRFTPVRALSASSALSAADAVYCEIPQPLEA